MQAFQQVVARIAGDLVVAGVAPAGPVGGAFDVQVLEVGAKGEVDQALHLVRALARRLDHPIAGEVDHVGVVAGPAGHAVDAAAAVQPVGARAAEQGVVALQAAQSVVARVANQQVVGGVAGTSQIVGAEQLQVLEVVGEGEADRRLDLVDAGARRLDHPIASSIDAVDIVAAAAPHHVRAGAARQRVRPAAAEQGVVAGAAVDRIVAAIASDGVVAIEAE